MKYTTALAVLLAFGPATTILAAPITQDTASALTAGPAPRGHDAPAPGGHDAPAPGGHAAPAPGGSSSQGMSGSSMGNEGLLDKVEKILKDLLSGLRKRGVVKEVGEVAKLALDSTSKLVNGQSSGRKSSFNTQSSDPDALPSTAPREPAPAPESDDSSSSGSELSNLLGGRSLTDPIDPVNTSGITAPISNDANPSAPAVPVDVAPLDTQEQDVEEEKKEKEGPNNGTPTTDPFKLTPEEIEALKMVLASQSNDGEGQGVPGLTE